MEANRRQPHCTARQGSQSDLSLARLEGSAVFTGSKQVASEGIWGIGVFVPALPAKQSPLRAVSCVWGPILKIIYSVVFRMKTLSQCQKSSLKFPFYF